MAANLKETLYTLADQLSDNATWDDVMEEVRFRRAIETGARAADQSDFATKEEIRTAFARWGVDIDSLVVGEFHHVAFGVAHKTKEY